MSGRLGLRYGQRGVHPQRLATGIDADAPIAGWYRMRLRSGGHPVGVRIFRGPPLDPIDGSELDRAWTWRATINDEPTDLDRVWPQCAGEPVEEAEHAHLCRTQAWGREHAPESPQANPFHKIDLLTAPLPF